MLHSINNNCKIKKIYAHCSDGVLEENPGVRGTESLFDEFQVTYSKNLFFFYIF